MYKEEKSYLNERNRRRQLQRRLQQQIPALISSV